MAEEPKIAHTHIQNTDIEFTTHADMLARRSHPQDAASTELYRLLLTEGGDNLVVVNEGDPFEFYGTEGEVTVIPDRGWALGYFLFGLETSSNALLNVDDEVITVTEDEAKAILSKAVDLQPYQEMLRPLTERDRRLRLVDLWEWHVDERDDYSFEVYREHSTWRETNLTKSGRKLAEQISRHIKVAPHFCYHTAGTAAVHAEGNQRVQYVEGIAMPEQACQAIRHAWIEIDEQVVELTWPWHGLDGGNAVYIGQPVPTERVKEVREHRGGGSPVLLDDEDARSFIDHMEPGATDGV